MTGGNPFLRRGVAALALLLTAFLLLGLFLDHAVTAAANRWLAASFSVPASVRKVTVSPLRGRVEAIGLRIENPPGFAQKEFLTMKRGELKVKLGSLAAGEIVAEWVRTEGLTVQVERSRGRENAREVFAQGAEKDPGKNEGKRFRIKKLILADTLVSFPFAGGQRVATLGLLTIDDPLGKDKGALLRDVVAQAVSRSLRAGAGQGLDGAEKAVRAGRSAADKVKGLFTGSGR